MTKRPRVTVLGSLNMDISVTVPRLPGPGATVLGSSARFTPGGKGANQAVAAARLGADVRMVGCVGDDDFGRQLLANLQAEGINADAVRTVPGAPTGVALITVDRSGENLITVAPGANRVVGPPEVAAATAGQADILVISAEIPVEAIAQALAGASGVTSVLNLAPVPENARALVADVADHLDYLVVNESEAAAVLGRDVDGLAAAQRAATDALGLALTWAALTWAALTWPPAGPATRWSPRVRTARPWPARTVPPRARGSGSSRSTRWARATRSSGRSPSPWRPAFPPRKPSGRPPPRAPRPSPATGPRPPCPAPRTSWPSPV